MDRVIYEPELGLEGTIPELISWAQRYTSDYSDRALERISELAKEAGMDEKDIRIPLLLKDERYREDKIPGSLPYERMKIDYLEYGRIGFGRSQYGADKAELEINTEDDKVVISLIGTDNEGSYTAAGAYSTQEFMAGDSKWLETAVGEVLYYSKVYD